jgi:peptidyl-prolyl cis-trans isomerase D
MMDFLRKHMRTVFIITTLAFLSGAFVGFGGYLFGKKSVGDSVVEINGTSIPYKRYSTMLSQVLENMRKGGTEVTDELMNQKKQEVIQNLVQEEVFWQEAKKYGIVVSDAELASDIQRIPAFQKEGAFDRMSYLTVLYQVLHTNPAEFEESRRKEIASYKLRNMISSSVKITEPELVMEYKIRNNNSLKDFDKKRADLLAELRKEKSMLVFNEWFKLLNRDLKVKVHLQEIEGTGSAS